MLFRSGIGQTSSNPSTVTAQDQAAQALSNLLEELPGTEPEVKAVVGTVGTQSRPAESLSSLQNLLNFTLQSERNGKTAQEVLDYLKVAQITHLPEGYNPFKRCS